MLILSVMQGANKLQNLIQKLKKWIKILEAKTRSLPKSFLIEEKCRFLSNFSRQTAEVELPGELLLPKHSHYQVCTDADGGGGREGCLILSRQTCKVLISSGRQCTNCNSYLRFWMPIRFSFRMN